MSPRSQAIDAGAPLFLITKLERHIQRLYRTQIGDRLTQYLLAVAWVLAVARARGAMQWWTCLRTEW